MTTCAFRWRPPLPLLCGLHYNSVVSISPGRRRGVGIETAFSPDWTLTFASGGSLLGRATRRACRPREHKWTFSWIPAHGGVPFDLWGRWWLPSARLPGFLTGGQTGRDLLADLRIRAVRSEWPLLLTFELPSFILFPVHPQQQTGMFPDCMLCVHAQ